MLKSLKESRLTQNYRSMSQPFKILSLCGGGVRGVLSATILTRLQQYNPKFLANIDLMAGTSTGAVIISLLLGDDSKGDIGERMVKFMEHYQPSVKNTNPDKPMYDINNFIDTLTAVHNGNPSISQFQQKFLMTSLQLGNSAASQYWDQIIFNNLGNSDNSEVGIVDATVSSAVMGGMFGAHQFTYKGSPIYTVDGAFAHHDPSLIAIAHAMNNGVAIEDIVIIDIGTGFMPHALPGETVKTWGCEQWVYAKNQEAIVPPLLTNQPFSIPVLDILLNGTNTTLLERQASMMLPERFANVNPQIKDTSETDSGAIPYLIEQGMKADLSQALPLVDAYWPKPTE